VNELLSDNPRKISVFKKGLCCSDSTATPFCILIFLFVLLLSTGCEVKIGGKKKGKNGTEKVHAPVVVTPSIVGDISTQLRLNGILKTDCEVQIFARTSGRIVELTVEEGDRIASGQLLARLDNDEQKLALERARTAFRQEQASLTRAEKLFDQNMLAEDEYERIKLSLEDAELRLKQAELSFEYTRVTSPFSGIIAERYVNYGDRVDASRPLYNLVDRSAMHLDGWVSEADIAKLRTGQEAIITSTALPDRSFEAVLARISPVVDPTFGKVKVTFDISGAHNPLKPGQFVELELTLETHYNVQLIAKRAIVYEAGVPVVFIYQDSTALRRRVDLGLQTGDIVEILSGIDVGSEVIIEGQATLRDSSLVKVVPPTR